MSDSERLELTTASRSRRPSAIWRRSISRVASISSKCVTRALRNVLVANGSASTAREVYWLASALVGEVEARLSAVVILVRDGAHGLEVFMVRRHARAEVIPNAYVFPGGTVRHDDYSLRGDDSVLAAM